MEYYAGLDVSLELTSVCIVDARGVIACEAKVASEPEALIGFFYASQDTNHDGYLNLDELLKGPLANFDCMDENHDGKLSQNEIIRGMERCGSVNLAIAPKH